MNAPGKKWVRVTPCGAIPEREGRCVEVCGRSIAIFHTQEGFFAVENRCPHRGGPLSDGIVNGASVVCPLHAWKFDLRTGRTTNHPESGALLSLFTTRVVDGVVCVELPLETGIPESPGVACEHRDRPLRWVQRKRLAPLPATVENKNDMPAGDGRGE